MLQSITHMSLSEVEAFEPLYTIPLKALLSIANPYQSGPVLRDGWSGVLFMRFDDTSKRGTHLTDHIYRPMTESLAFMMVGFIKGIERSGKTCELIVNCNGGMSRSPAVCAAIVAAMPSVRWTNPRNEGDWNSAVYSQLGIAFQEFKEAS